MISEVASKMRAMGFLGVNLLNTIERQTYKLVALGQGEKEREKKQSEDKRFCGERGGGHVKVEIRVKAPLKRHPDSTVQSLVTIVE